MYVYSVCWHVAIREAPKQRLGAGSALTQLFSGYCCCVYGTDTIFEFICVGRGLLHHG